MEKICVNCIQTQEHGPFCNFDGKGTAEICADFTCDNWKPKVKKFKSWINSDGTGVIHLLTFHYEAFNSSFSVMVFLNDGGRVLEKEYQESMLVDNIRIRRFQLRKLWQFIIDNECTVDMENLIK